MTPTILVISCVLLLPAESSKRAETPRKASPFAPSLPQLSDDEEEQLDQVIDRFIAYDTGKLRGNEGKKALQDFQLLGPEAIFALIRGLNRAANIETSCPAVIIGRKIAMILRTTRDPELLEFARENIGIGVTKSRHKGLLNDLRVVCIIRKRALGQTVARFRTRPDRSDNATSKALRRLSTSELIKAAGVEHGSKLKDVLVELAKRDGDKVTNALGTAATTYDRSIQKLARDLLVRQLSRRSTAALKYKLGDESAAIRAAAAHVVGNKKLPLGPEVIDLLTDDEPAVRQAAHDALIRLSGGTDFGPGPGATEADWAKAVQRWRQWWARKKPSDARTRSNGD